MKRFTALLLCAFFSLSSGAQGLGTLLFGGSAPQTTGGTGGGGGGGLPMCPVGTTPNYITICTCPPGDVVGTSCVVPSGGGGLQITTASLTACVLGSACSDALAATGGSGTGYKFNIVTNYPNTTIWQYVTPAGVVSGTPQYAEIENVTYQVTDSANNIATRTYTLTASVTGSLAIVSPTSIATAPINGYFAYHMIASGGVPPYWWTSSSSATQPCNMTNGGWIECSPTGAGSLTMPATVTDSAGHTVSQTETITVGSALQVAQIDSSDGLIHLPPAAVGTPYIAHVYGYGGTAPYTFTSGGLPAWATLNLSTGAITGTPTSSGNIEPTFQVHDNVGATALATAHINISRSATASRPAYNSGSGYFIVGTKLYDPNGNLFTLRGDNQLHYNSAAPTYLPNTFANSVRIWDGNHSTATYLSLANAYISAGMMPILTQAYVPGTGTGTSGDTSTTDLQAVVNWWNTNVGAFAPIMNSIAVNIANEWGPNYSSGGGPTWSAAIQSAVTSMRAAGYTCPIIADLGSHGQDAVEILKYAAAIEAADPRHATIFSYHMYGSSVPWAASITNITKGATTVITVNGTASYHPLNPGCTTNGCYSGIAGFYISGVNGMVQINGAWNAPTNLYGSSGNWQVQLPVNSSGFATYTSGGVIVADSVDFGGVGSNGGNGNSTNYGYMISALAGVGVPVLIGEFGPGTDGNTGNPNGMDPINPAQITVEQVIGATEAYGLVGWVDWADDDNNLTGNMTSWADWYGQTLTTGVSHLWTPTDLTASGLDVIDNPRYGFGALAH